LKGVQVTTTARLHLGFLDLAGDLGRRFGSIGLAIDAFETRVELREAPSFEVLGEERDRGAHIVRRVAESLGLDKARGALIASIDPASPATQSGLRPGDVILSYDGKPVDRSRQLPRFVADSAPEKPVKLTIWRDGKEAEVTLTVVAFDPNRPQPQPPAPEQPKPPPSVDALGLKIAKLTPEWRKYFGVPEAARGVVVVEVPQNSAGSAQGLHTGDLIVAAGAGPVASPDDVLQQIAAAKKAGHKNILVRVEREGNFRFITMPIETG